MQSHTLFTSAQEQKKEDKSTQEGFINFYVTPLAEYIDKEYAKRKPLILEKIVAVKHVIVSGYYQSTIDEKFDVLYETLQKYIKDVLEDEEYYSANSYGRKNSDLAFMISVLKIDRNNLPTSRYPSSSDEHIRKRFLEKLDDVPAKIEKRNGGKKSEIAIFALNKYVETTKPKAELETKPAQTLSCVIL